MSGLLHVLGYRKAMKHYRPIFNIHLLFSYRQHWKQSCMAEFLPQLQQTPREDLIGTLAAVKSCGLIEKQKKKVFIIPFSRQSHRESKMLLRFPVCEGMNHTSAANIIIAACACCELVYLWNCVILRDIARNNFIISLNSKMSCNRYSQNPNPQSCRMLFNNKCAKLF